MPILAGNSIAWRLLPDAAGHRLAGLLEVALDGLVGTLVGITLTLTLADLRLLGVAFDALLYFYLVSRTLPRFLPDGPPAGDTLGSRRFVYAASGAVLCLGFPLSMFLPVLFAASPVALLADATGLSLAAPSAPVAVGFFFGWNLLLWVGISWYVHRSWWSTADLDERVAFYDQVLAKDVDRAEVRRMVTRDGWLGSLFRRLALLVPVILVVTMLAFFAVLSGFVIILFPLPELVLLTAAVGSVVANRWPGGRLSGLADRRIDIEERFFRMFRYARASRKGIVIVPYLTLGLVFSMLLALLSNVGLFAIGYLFVVRSGEAARLTLQSPLRMWGALAILCCTAVPGLYSLWFWYREARRIPHYLLHWEETHAGSAAIQSAEDLPPLPTRPVGNLLVPSLLFAPIYVGYKLAPDQGDPPLVFVAALAVGATALLVFAGLSIRRTFHRPPQHPRTDAWAIPLAFLVQVGWFWWLFGDGGMIVDSSFGLRQVAMVALLSMMLFFMEDLWQWLEDRIGDYASAVAMALLGTGFLALAVFEGVRTSGTTVVFLVLAGGALVTLFLGGFAGLVTWRLADEE
ncbi:hypothetical protein [Haloglomus litoreum]|uniref:hypothetical protein n=1 Tax=Haloglomus litoreum TaxID=3034026 RepID=UPI0023E84073|nr:hypothetical protein [Haloglomus sp. DT116]